MQFDFISYDELNLNKYDIKTPEIIQINKEKNILILDEKILTLAIKMCFEKLSFYFTKKHIEKLICAILNKDASKNDRYVCATLLKNAQISSEYNLPICQDTGIANIFAWKDEGIIINGNENKAITLAIAQTYIEKKLRFSTTIPSSIFAEKNPKNNLPANIAIFSTSSKNNSPTYKFLCCAKGGGSSNKTIFCQETKTILNEKKLYNFLKQKINEIGTSACPPYTIGVVIGGLSPEQNLFALKLATCTGFDNEEKIERINNSFSLNSNIIRDLDWEKIVMEICEQTGFGAQFGGTRMALDAIVLRLPRHAASCPISIGVSCSAHRNLEMYINEKGIYIEKTIQNLTKIKNFEKAISYAKKTNKNIITLDTNKGINKSLEILSNIKCGQRIQINGKILVARDAAHAKWKEDFENGKSLPDYCKKFPICYAGPSQTPENYIIGSFGPTTAERMDSYADFLMNQGASLITIAKGNRSKEFTNICKKYGGIYLGIIGGAAALIAKKYITNVEIIDFEELGMEAVRLLTVKNLPAFLLTDNKGNDFYNI
ncbi:MAG: fumarate hydrolyase [Treponema sp.]|nr:fumarate hydrolyase [Treponema sp.]